MNSWKRREVSRISTRSQARVGLSLGNAEVFEMVNLSDELPPPLRLTRLWAKRHLALTGPGGKREQSALRQEGPTFSPQWSHSSSSLPPIPRRPADVL